ncbi:hypothetical protein [Saccharopolyspora hattusasensis]|uniref:hypothetical protein n=1 Tax=Saccharopolyspora hattusasensis TaxID=1128679 RepID=UPI003D95F265
MADEQPNNQAPGDAEAKHHAAPGLTMRQFGRLLRTDPHKDERGMVNGPCRTVGCPGKALWILPREAGKFGIRSRLFRCVDCIAVAGRLLLDGTEPDEQQIVSDRGIRPPAVEPSTELAEIRALLLLCDRMADLAGICGERYETQATEALFEKIDDSQAEIAQRFGELDEWISAGGQLPQQWQHAHPGNGR